MNRVYSVTFTNLSLTGDGKDVIEIIAAAGKPIRPLSALFTLYDSETNEQLTLAMRLATGSYSTGTSPNSTPTPSKHGSSTLPAASFSAKVGCTSPAAAGSGALVATHVDGFPSQGGWSWLPTPQLQPTMQGAEAVVFHLVKGPASATGINGTVYVEEL